MDEQTYQEQSLKLLQSINERLAGAAGNRKPFWEKVAISATVPIIVDYRDRKHVYLFTQNTLTLTLEDMGTLAVTAGTWADISFRPGMNIFAQSQASIVYVDVLQTDDAPAAVGGSGGGGGGGAITAAAGSYAVGWSNEFTEVAADADEIAASVANIPLNGLGRKTIIALE